MVVVLALVARPPSLLLCSVANLLAMDFALKLRDLVGKESSEIIFCVFRELSRFTTWDRLNFERSTGTHRQTCRQQGLAPRNAVEFMGAKVTFG